MTENTKNDEIKKEFTVQKEWESFLLQHSLIYSQLMEEKKRGWESEALQQFYQRREFYQYHQEKKKEIHNNNNNNSNNKVSSFAVADIDNLTERYRKHIREKIKECGFDFFSNDNNDNNNSRERVFLDIGCAPGGVSLYLLRDVTSSNNNNNNNNVNYYFTSGYGLSLSMEEGGIALCPSLLKHNDTENNNNNKSVFFAVEGDVTKPSSTWKIVDPNNNNNNASLPTLFDFINGGAVQDYLQRVQQEEEEKHNNNNSNTNDVMPQNNTSSTSSNSSEALLPWFTLLLPQLRIILQQLRHGAPAMCVFGVSHGPSLYLLLYFLHQLQCETENNNNNNNNTSIQLFETIHTAKNPLYIFMPHLYTFNKDNNADSKKEAQGVKNQRLIERLLASMDANDNSVISPLEDSPLNENLQHHHHNNNNNNRIKALKQQYWLGETEESFNLAKETFLLFQTKIEKIWTNMFLFLKNRREKAERQAEFRSQKNDKNNPKRTRNNE